MIILEMERLRLYFNSQPHKEADKKSGIRFTENIYFNSQPHKEADRRTQDMMINSTDFNSQPHKEADSNFKQKSFYIKLFFIFITQILFNFPSHHHILQCPTYKTRPFSGANVLGFSAHIPFALQY